MRDKESINASKRKYWNECKDFINEQRAKPKQKRFCSECKAMFFTASFNKRTCGDDCASKRRARLLKEYNAKRSHIFTSIAVAKNSVTKKRATKSYNDKYTKEEEKEIMNSKNLFETALKLGRSYCGVRAKRVKMMKMTSI